MGILISGAIGLMALFQNCSDSKTTLKTSAVDQRILGVNDENLDLTSDDTTEVIESLDKGPNTFAGSPEYEVLPNPMDYIGLETGSNRNIASATEPSGGLTANSITSPSATTLETNLLYKARFESGKIYTGGTGSVDSFIYGNYSPGCVLNKTNYSNSNDSRVVTTPVRTGKYGFAMTIRYFKDSSNTTKCDYRPLNEYIRQKPRQQIAVPAKVVTAKLGQKRWIGFSIRVGSDFVFDKTDNPDVLFQLFNRNNRNLGASSANLEIRGDKLVFISRMLKLPTKETTVKAGKVSSDSNYCGSKALTVSPCVISEVVLERNKWYDFAIEFLPSQSGSGILRVWRNNSKVPVIDLAGYNTNDTEMNIYYDLYKHNWRCKSEFQSDETKCNANPSATNSKAPRTVFYDEIMVGNGSSSLTQVSPHMPSL